MKFLTRMFTAFALVLSVTLGLAACDKQDSASTKIGIILPLEHKALQEIVEGFSKKLQEIYQKPLQINVLNAQGDINLQRAIIQQMQNQGYQLIVPIGMSTSEMTLSMVHDLPILSLAAEISEATRQKRQPCNVGVVHDEIPQQKLIAFIHTAFPEIKHLTLIHSTSDKVFPEIKATIAAAKEKGITVSTIMVATLPELLNASQTLSAETQGIFVLKDHLIVSGITTLAKTAHEKHIPLFTSDEGSVEAGAGFALGVHERQIGEEGAKLAVEVLNGKSICELPIVEMNKLTVFMNRSALTKEQQDPKSIEAAAKTLHYETEFVAEK